MTAPPARIDDYAVIGDGRSVALVARSGAIDWLCWPRFECPPIFGALLDPARGGAWRIHPRGVTRIDRRYEQGTNVLLTELATGSGACVLTDVMTICSEDDKARMLVPDHEVIRRIDCTRGHVVLDVEVEVRPDFGRAPTSVHDLGRLGIRWQAGSRLIALRAETPMTLGADGVARTTLHLRAGEAASFSLTFDEEGPAVMPPLGAFTRAAIDRSAAWWRRWSARASYRGPDRDAVVRSALALKLMSFAPSGALVAAPTTSLPERIGGDLNWDYRYCWLRDSSFTARVLLDLGYVEDAEAFGNWLLHTTRLTRPEVRVLYDVYGRPPVGEHEVPGIEGYRGSLPVRIGNAASAQLQLDTYGELIDAISQVVEVTGSIDNATRGLLRDLASYVRHHWREPDAGIWEPRSGPRHRTHSRLLCWVALDRVLELHQRGFLDGIGASQLATERAMIRREIEEHAYDASLACYTSELGPSPLDASVLLMSWYGFHPGSAGRMRATYARVADRLGAGPGLFYRHEDSLHRREGAFWICSFWAVEHLVRGGGTLDEARALFDRACAYANDLGLMAEEVDPGTGQALGNFPQAYTHVGLISAALSIAQRAEAVS